MAVAALASPAHADCNDPFGKPNEVLDFHIKMKRADWNALVASTVRNFDGLPLDSPACKDEFPKFQAEFRCGTDGAWMAVGVRKKRGTERGAEVPQKPPFKIDFNEDFMGKVPQAKGQRWPASMGELGYRKLTLNNGQSNKAPDRPTMMLPVLLQEHVALRLLKREVPSTPGTAYAKVTLHTEDKPDGEYHGVYILIEDIDRTAVKRRWGDATGKLIKQSKANCSPEIDYDDGPPNAAADAFAAWIKKNPSTFPGKWIAETEKGVALDTLLRQEAIREIIVNGDDTLSYAAVRSNQGNNWLAFEPMVGLREFMPWDLDLTFGQQFGNCQPTPLKCAPTIPLLKHCATTTSVVGKLTVCNSEVQKRYLEVMCQMTNGSMSGAEILKIWEQAYTTVAPVVPLEKHLWNGQDPSSTTADKSFGSEYVRLKSWIPERVKFVQQQIAAKGVACSAGCQAGAKEPCRYLTCAGERRCEGGSWTTCQPMAGCTPGAAPATPGSDGGTPDGAARTDGGAPDGPARTDGGATIDATSGTGGTAGTGGMSMGTGGGSGGTTGGGTPGGMTPRPPRGGAGGGPAEPTDVDDDGGKRGGGCSVGATSGGGAWGVLLALAALAVRRRRRR